MKAVTNPVRASDRVPATDRHPVTDPGMAPLGVAPTSVVSIFGGLLELAEPCGRGVSVHCDGFGRRGFVVVELGCVEIDVW